MGGMGNTITGSLSIKKLVWCSTGLSDNVEHRAEL